MMPKKPRRAAILLAIVVALCPILAFAQEEEKPAPVSVYSMGQQSFALSLGLFIPLFFMDFDGAIPDSTNLKLGGFGSLQWGIHLNNHWLVGAELGGIFSKSLQENFMYMLAITAKGMYIFHAFPFEFPVFLGAGMDIIKYGAQSHLDFILKPGFATIWKYNVNWGFGLNVIYWWVPQPWPAEPSKGLMGNFLEVSLTAQYSF
jgi:hypothetical protein